VSTRGHVPFVVETRLTVRYLVGLIVRSRLSKAFVLKTDTLARHEVEVVHFDASEVRGRISVATILAILQQSERAPKSLPSQAN
jgi:hypothetical protein